MFDYGVKSLVSWGTFGPGSFKVHGISRVSGARLLDTLSSSIGLSVFKGSGPPGPFLKGLRGSGILGTLKGCPAWLPGVAGGLIYVFNVYSSSNVPDVFTLSVLLLPPLLLYLRRYLVFYTLPLLFALIIIYAV